MISLFLALIVAAPAFAVQPDEMLADPALEARARAISKEVRCLVCRNESIDDSNASLARDLRLLVRERLTAGDSDAEVLDYLVERYGEFVLLKPKFSAANAARWLAGPAAFLTPIGHKNNTLILGPGGYRFGDYWRMGLPLEVIVLVAGIPAIMLFWPF